MITIDFYATVDLEPQRLVATLEVGDDGYELSDPEHFVDLAIPARDADAPDGQVHFEQEPTRWALQAPTIFRTPYLAAEVRRDVPEHEPAAS